METRFQKSGIEGLMDKKGRGVKAKYKDQARITQKAREKPSGGLSELEPAKNCQRIGNELGHCSKTLKAHALKRHKVDYWCGKSTDPEFEEKMLNVIGLYLHLGEMLCFQ